MSEHGERAKPPDRCPICMATLGMVVVVGLGLGVVLGISTKHPPCPAASAPASYSDIERKDHVPARPAIAGGECACPPKPE